MSYQADIAIIGAGVVGLAIASQVASEDRNVYLLEKNETFGQEASSRNSEVIHAGVYYPKDSLKARMCLEGNALLYELCQKHRISYKKIGKIIVATNDTEAEELEKLYKRGRNNGIELKMLSHREMRQLEPNIKGVAAFFSPSTGIIDSQALMRYFLGKARDNGTQIAYRTKVIGIDKISGGYKVRVEDSHGSFSFATKILINCAGLHSDELARMAGIDVNEAGYKLHWYKGEYYSVSSSKSILVNRLIYPVPMAIGLGVHVCFDVSGRMRLGPLYYYVNEIDYKVDDSRRKAFCQSPIMRALPFIECHDLEPEMAGIKASLQREGENFRDFVINHECDRDLPGLINLIGIDSPGLTSSPAIAKYVGTLVREILKNN